MLAPFRSLAQAQGKECPAKYPTLYHTIQIDGLSIFYREAGPKAAPTLLLRPATDQRPDPWPRNSFLSTAWKRYLAELLEQTKH